MIVLNEKEFPGLDEIWNVLPHPGRLLLEYFEFYKQINLKPDWWPDEIGDTVKLAVYRGDKPWLTGSTGCTLPTVNLERAGYEIADFVIRDNHVGKFFSELRHLQSKYLANRVKDFCNEHKFSLVIGKIAREQLLSAIQYIFIFTAKVRSRDGFTTNATHYIDIRLKKEVENTVPGLCYDQIIRLRWDDLIPRETPHFQALSALVKWDETWHLIREMSLTRGVVFGNKANWRNCCRELNRLLLAAEKHEKLLI